MAVVARERQNVPVETQGVGADRRQRFEEIGGKAIIYLLLALGSIIFVAPFVWMVTASLQDVSDMFRWPPSWIPRSPSLDNYVDFFRQERIGRYFFNSAFVALSVTALQLFTSSLAAYTFAKRRFPGRDLLFIITLGTMMIPGQVTLIPNYVILKQIPFFGGNNWLGTGGSGWLDSYWGLIVPQAASAFGIFLMRQYMKSIPDDLLDAARMDGASEFRIYAQIVMPLCRPALAALGIFTFSYVWDDFFWPLIITSSEELRTLPLGLALFVVRNRTAWDLLMAGSVITTIPVLIVFLMFQRHFIRGIAVTGMK
ncbi:MAG: ABC transporter, permease protein 2 (cluster 1, maltose/g3p/polyamine/iron) [uncultured Thermomicrobiales bacterium]|uniref:ABC transporter, permease protein 2 (Cluster 1, maltose/g3p/polyamine/iron) n=1 Tax=uncultured Thermomicrobiales bacterium TaxID=1645740 RepID=A0A6J4V9E3_9BACT|nr:MAG: ABC transporter, permease protein 2 (cluster 1, maltose/g3p/polyamine/iron) [uncultured Thermomicrobiales bacterium]